MTGRVQGLPGAEGTLKARRKADPQECLRRRRRGGSWSEGGRGSHAEGQVAGEAKAEPAEEVAAEPAPAGSPQRRRPALKHRLLKHRPLNPPIPPGPMAGPLAEALEHLVAGIVDNPRTSPSVSGPGEAVEPC